MILLTVDPGMSTGWALWDITTQGVVKYGQIRLDHVNLEADLTALFDRFRDINTSVNLRAGQSITRVCIEYPGMWQNSFTSHTSAASGDLVKLAAIVGGFAAIAHEWQTGITLISPQRWKGQMSKEAVKARVERELGIQERSSHINDALGIGLFLFKRLNRITIVSPFKGA